MIKGIIERTTDDEGMLFEALYLHDELQQIISKYEELEISQKSEEHQQLENSDSTRHEESEAAEKNGETLPQKSGTEPQRLDDAKEKGGGKQPDNFDEVGSSSQLGSQKETKIVDFQTGGISGSLSEKEGA